MERFLIEHRDGDAVRYLVSPVYPASWTDSTARATAFTVGDFKSMGEAWPFLESCTLVPIV